MTQAVGVCHTKSNSKLIKHIPNITPKRARRFLKCLQGTPTTLGDVSESVPGSTHFARHTPAACVTQNSHLGNPKEASLGDILKVVPKSTHFSRFLKLAFLAVFFRPCPWAAAIQGGEKEVKKTHTNSKNNGFT